MGEQELDKQLFWFGEKIALSLEKQKFVGKFRVFFGSGNGNDAN